MAETKKHISLTDHVLNLLDNDKTREDIQAELLQMGHEEKFVKELVQETIKLRNAKRRTTGLQLVVAGAVICFASFLCTITTTSINGHFPYVLYGLTGLGVIVAFAGFTKVF